MALLDIVNNSNLETLILNPVEALGLIDLRSLGYYKIQQGVIQHKLSRFYHFESAEEVCTQFNNLINTNTEGAKGNYRRKIPMVR